jgi:hypothetical protein
MFNFKNQNIINIGYVLIFGIKKVGKYISYM